MTQIIDGKAISEQIKAEIKIDVAKLKAEKGIVPGLAVILVGENPASQTYVGAKQKACEEAGFLSITDRQPSTISENDLLDLVRRYNNRSDIHGILVQLPLPDHINSSKVIETIDYKKDVDGFHPINAGKLVIGEPCFAPCTPAGIVVMLERSGHLPDGKHVVVIGRSNIVGKPMANLLVQKSKTANATVTICHTGTKNIARFTKQADIIIAAVGRQNSVTADMIKDGVVIIDVGMNRIADPSKKSGFRLVGDVDYEGCFPKCAAITPVPGGVGPMTIAMLLKNTFLSATGKIFS